MFKTFTRAGLTALTLAGVFCSSVCMAEEIDTGLAKLSIQEIDLKPQFKAQAFGPYWIGALDVVGDRVYAINAAGEIVRVDDGQAINTGAWYDNGRDSFNQRVWTSGAKIWPNNFRFTDILVRDGVLYLAGMTWHSELDCFGLSVQFTDEQSLGPQSIWTKLYETQPCIPFASDVPFTGQELGGRMDMSSDGHLLLSVGHFGFEGGKRPNYPQDLAVDYGEIFEIDLSTGKATVVSIGLRNPQGLFVASDGSIFETEHGPQGGDELNLVRRGANFGWPNATLGTDYGEYSWPGSADQGRHDGFEWPLYAWMPSIGVSNLIQVRSSGSRWDGDLLVGSLNGKTLYRLRMHEGRVIYQEPISFSERIRDVGQLADGRFVLLFDDARLEYITLSTPLHRNEVDVAPGISDAVANILARCTGCHSTEKGVAGGAAPSLWGVVGRPVASTDFPRYSEDMKSLGGVWTRERLDQLLSSPTTLVPKSMMASVSPIADAALRHDLIEYLATLHD